MKRYFLLLSLLFSLSLSVAGKHTTTFSTTHLVYSTAGVAGKPDTLYYPTADSLATTYDPNDKLSDAMHNKIFKWYNKHKWKKLELLFADTINGGWPPANGGYDTYTVMLKKGATFDRYQSTLSSQTVNGEPLLTGTFFSPIIDGDTIPYKNRALRQPKSASALYYQVEVLEDLTFKAQNATIIPWFNQPGEGIQTNWNIPLSGSYPISLTQLALDGKIRITIVDSPSGSYDNLKGKTIPATK